MYTYNSCMAKIACVLHLLHLKGACLPVVNRLEIWFGLMPKFVITLTFNIFHVLESFNLTV